MNDLNQTAQEIFNELCRDFDDSRAHYRGLPKNVALAFQKSYDSLQDRRLCLMGAYATVIQHGRPSWL